MNIIIAVNESARSDKKGPVIKRNGINIVNINGILKKNIEFWIFKLLCIKLNYCLIFFFLILRYIFLNLFFQIFYKFY